MLSYHNIFEFQKLTWIRLNFGIFGAEFESTEGFKSRFQAYENIEESKEELAISASVSTAVLLALNYPEAELFHVVNDSGASMLLSTDEHQGLMENVAAKCATQFSLLPSVPSIPSNLTIHEQLGAEPAVTEIKVWEEIGNSKLIEGDKPASIVYTCGTTGVPTMYTWLSQGYELPNHEEYYEDGKPRAQRRKDSGYYFVNNGQRITGKSYSGEDFKGLKRLQDYLVKWKGWPNLNCMVSLNPLA